MAEGYSTRGGGVGAMIFSRCHHNTSSGNQTWHRRGVASATPSTCGSSTPGMVNLWMEVALNRCLLASNPCDRACCQCAVMEASRRPPLVEEVSPDRLLSTETPRPEPAHAKCFELCALRPMPQRPRGNARPSRPATPRLVVLKLCVTPPFIGLIPYGLDQRWHPSWPG